MIWTLIFWFKLSYAASMNGSNSPPVVAPGYYSQDECVNAGKSLPQAQFEFYCIPGGGHPL